GSFCRVSSGSGGGLAACVSSDAPRRGAMGWSPPAQAECVQSSSIAYVVRMYDKTNSRVCGLQLGVVRGHVRFRSLQGGGTGRALQGPTREWRLTVFGPRGMAAGDVIVTEG